MNEKVVLDLDRSSNDLWINVGSHIACIWDVTGLEGNVEFPSNHVNVLREGKIIGVVWHVKEIKERW